MVLAPGCVTRKLMLRSDPPGARVMVDGHTVGTTPWEGELGSYGTRRIEFELEGHVRHVELARFSSPWWQLFPLDIVTDLLLPWTIEDVRTLEVELAPQQPDEGSWEEARAVWEQRARPDDGER
jgi:hypothetical protein